MSENVKKNRATSSTDSPAHQQQQQQQPLSNITSIGLTITPSPPISNLEAVNNNQNSNNLNISTNILNTSTSSFVSSSSSSSSSANNPSPNSTLQTGSVSQQHKQQQFFHSHLQTISSSITNTSSNNNNNSNISNTAITKNNLASSSASNLLMMSGSSSSSSGRGTIEKQKSYTHNTNSNSPNQTNNNNIIIINSNHTSNLCNNTNNPNNINLNTSMSNSNNNNNNSNEIPLGNGHFFTKKTFHKPTYCHHCTEMLWGLIGQGFTCEVCNFVCHEKCQKWVVSPCSSIAHNLIKNPVSHCWSEPTHYKRKFCNICRKRLEDNLSLRCEICEYYVHVDCQVLAVNDCCETATYVPNRDLKCTAHYHHWREGNLPSNSKCVVCKKTCWTSECLAGLRCEWCGLTTHSFCRQKLIEECNFGNLKEIMVPPYAVSVPRISMNKETILGIQSNRNTKTRSNSIEISSGSEQTKQLQLQLPESLSTTEQLTPTLNYNNSSSLNNTNVPYSSQSSNQSISLSSPGGNNGSSPSPNLKENQNVSSKKKEKYKQQLEDEEDSKETIRVYDGNSSLRKKSFRTIVVSKNCTYQTLLEASLRTFHINDDLSKYYLSIPLNSLVNNNSLSDEISSNNINNSNNNINQDEILVDESSPIKSIKSISTFDGSNKFSILLRYKDESNEQIRIYPCVFKENASYLTVTINSRTTVLESIKIASEKFDINNNADKYYLIEVLIDQDAGERILSSDEYPLQIIRQLRKESLCNIRMLRFYLKQKEDPHGPSVALFVGNLPSGLSQIQYERIIQYDILKNRNDAKWSRFDVIYYEYGSMVILFDDSEKAIKAFKMLKDAVYDNKQLMVLLLPTIQPRMIPSNVTPLLVFVNVKSGGQQGLDLISSFRHLLNPHQVFDLQNGGPLPGLYVFRNIESYKILACGGDGTIGWVLSCLDNVSQDAKCQSPPMAIVPLGTGNDLARVLRWGAGYTGAEEPINLLRDVIDAEEILLDRWTVVFHSDENKELEDAKKQINQANTNEDNTEIYVMNNYIGIGIDAEVALDFHTAREENPNKFNSRLQNKKYYVQMGLRKIMNKSSCKDLNRLVSLEVDGRKIDMPQIEGIIILNIQSWAGGSNPWGSEKDDQFQKSTHYDGMLEVVGIKGVLHMGQISGGLSGAIRVAQGGRVKIRINGELPVHVDGEPWSQPPCSITIIKSALKATMLKKSKIKIKRRNTEPYVNAILPAMNNTVRGETEYLDPDAESEPF